ncbi:MAG: hypothetical protein R3344_13195, partial [Acidobacteriota bacterium]|nr:hypothetical protein [Acidobacteriota bacterium]
MPNARNALACIVVSGWMLCSGASAFAASHRWVVNEVFSNADGTVQFVELYCPIGAANETALTGKAITSQINGTIHTFAADLPANSTSDKHLLLATQAFADLPGAPTPDHIIAANSFSISADSLQWHIYVASILSFTAGELPTDGINSLDQAGGTAVNSPTNFNNESGSVDASSGPPAVPDGSAGSNPMTVAKQDATGSTLEVFWDYFTSSCNSQIWPPI